MSRKLNVLIAEDNEDHQVLISYSLQRADICQRIDQVPDGEKALQFLRREGEYINAQRPDIIFLDINMPRLNGLEVLEALKTDATLKRIPVIILSTSNAESDRTAAYELHANSYLVKEFDKLQEMMAEVGKYWSTWNKMPPELDPEYPEHQDS